MKAGELKEILNREGFRVREVALASGVSESTIHNVINNPSTVSPKSLTRVQRGIERLRADFSARASRSVTGIA